ncbi:hypothetical protein FGB62_216g037 [Gracilaria domingensis]|nr:hypothetical protein FGB62_216g037 [Gracilaria domingensis]
MVLATTSPGSLAVLIGAVELLIVEFFRFLMGRALAARRSVVLSRFGRLHLLSAARQNDRFQMCISAISLLVVVVLVVLGLSIEGIVLRQPASSIWAMCYAPERFTRYIGGFGPFASEAGDTRFSAYLEQTACTSSLLNTALSGTSGLQIGYPTCSASFDEPRHRTFVAEFQGCGVGFVANSEAGDLHCDLLPSGINNQSSLEGTSFLAVFESGRNSTSSFMFNDDPDQRCLSNSRIPDSWMVNSTAESVSIDCVDLSLDCYLLSRERAKTAPKTVRESTAQSGLYIQVLQNGNSSVCLFENGMHAQAQWLELNQSLPGADERTRRAGPVLTGFVLSGEAKCVENLDSLTARLQYDATEYASSLPADNVLEWLQRYVLGTGIKTPFESSRSCQVFELVEGSSVSFVWLVAACGLSGVLMVASVLALVYVIWVKAGNTFKSDPLTPLWAIREVLEMRGKARTGSDAKILGDVYVGVVERNGIARFDVFENCGFERVRNSTKPFSQT